ncbi:MAG TPA: hypothetical protein VFS36_08250 [Chitinophagaceae bacterium]|jgi:hypothetical protein|nr:hypothetical protein [Chitinophagaceae bacterium]
MATTIAEHYADELVEWRRLIDFYDQEMDDLETKLVEVIRRNSIPGIAARVEQQQSFLNEIADEFDKLSASFTEQESVLKTDDSFVDDKDINIVTEKKQNELRRHMQQAEKTFLDRKHTCSNFLSGLLKR